MKFVKLEYIMLHAKFHDHRNISSVGEVFTIFGRDGHLSHVTLPIYINLLSPFPRRLHIKFGFDWPSGFRKDI